MARERGEHFKTYFNLLVSSEYITCKQGNEKKGFEMKLGEEKLNERLNCSLRV